MILLNRQRIFIIIEQYFKANLIEKVQDAMEDYDTRQHFGSYINTVGVGEILPNSVDRYEEIKLADNSNDGANVIGLLSVTVELEGYIYDQEEEEEVLIETKTIECWVQFRLKISEEDTARHNHKLDFNVMVVYFDEDEKISI